jgi:hypothetical protein
MIGVVSERLIVTVLDRELQNADHHVLRLLLA